MVESSSRRNRDTPNGPNDSISSRLFNHTSIRGVESLGLEGNRKSGQGTIRFDSFTPFFVEKNVLEIVAKILSVFLSFFFVYSYLSILFCVKELESSRENVSVILGTSENISVGQALQVLSNNC